MPHPPPDNFHVDTPLALHPLRRAEKFRTLGSKRAWCISSRDTKAAGQECGACQVPHLLNLAPTWHATRSPWCTASGRPWKLPSSCKALSQADACAKGHQLQSIFKNLFTPYGAFQNRSKQHVMLLGEDLKAFGWSLGSKRKCPLPVFQSNTSH